jgi:hypothetical protein
MMSFFVVNLLIPTEPSKVDIRTPSGTWKLEQFPDYAKSETAIGNGNAPTPITWKMQLSWSRQRYRMPLSRN